jgi:FkbM family methyltransferase
LVQIEPYRWRLTPSFIAHLWKAVTQQHHRVLLPVLAYCVPRDGVVLDVGAHAGQFAKLFARLAPEGWVYAIEPGSYARSILRTAIWARRLANITILPVALGAEPGLARLHIPVKASGALGFGLSHFGQPEERWPRVAAELVAQTTVDELAETLALDRLDFIKADIEGNEMRMLRGAERTLKRFRPGLLLELTAAQLARAGDDVAGVFSFLEELGYSGFVMGPNGWLVPAKTHGDNDFWFFDADDPFAFMLTVKALRPESTEKRAGNGSAC